MKTSTDLALKREELIESGKLLNTAETFTARVYVGLYDTESDLEQSQIKLRRSCQQFVEEVGLCVNVQETVYQYGSNRTGGKEKGAVVELIHYPRFEHGNPEEKITVNALDLAEMLMEEFHQKRVSVVTNTETYTLQNPDHEDVL